MDGAWNPNFDLYFKTDVIYRLLGMDNLCLISDRFWPVLNAINRVENGAHFSVMLK